MSSGFTPLWKRLLRKYIPVLFSKCPEGNYHWKRDRMCICDDSMNKAVYWRFGKRWVQITDRHFKYKD